LNSKYIAEDKHAGRRIDVVLKTLEPGCSRAALQRMISAGRATVNDRTVAPDYTVRLGDNISYKIPASAGPPVPEEIPLDVLHEDDSIIVIDKPAGLTVHPVRPKHGGTLVNALLAYTDELSDIGGPLRRGIVHRLDRDTSGVMVAARTNSAHADLTSQFKKRQVTKEYTAIVEGNLQLDADEVCMGVSRHARHPKRMAAAKGGKEARTEYEVIERFSGYTLVLVRPSTGRTHQIRLMFSELGHPVACDSAYGAKKTLPGERRILKRQALHSSRLGFAHPATGEPVEFEAGLPADMREAVVLLHENCGIMKE